MKYSTYLQHHGILGQKWGVRRYQNADGSLTAAGRKRYVNDSTSLKDKSKSDKIKKSKVSNTNKLTDEQKAKIKKYILIGSAAVTTGLAIYGTQKLIKNKAMEKIISEGNIKADRILKQAQEMRIKAGGMGSPMQNNRFMIYTSKANNLQNLSVDVRKESVNKANDVGKSLIKSIKELRSKLPIDSGGLTNPNKKDNNCKEVAEATLKRWLGVDAGAVAVERTPGNLRDMISRHRYNPKGVTFFNDEGMAPSSQGNTGVRVSNNILKKFKNGDCGMVDVTWNLTDAQKAKYDELGRPYGHVFNWLIKDNKVIFIDDQPDPPIYYAIKYFENVSLNTNIDVVRITKEAFEK